MKFNNKSFLDYKIFFIGGLFMSKTRNQTKDELLKDQEILQPKPIPNGK